ncbi:MULTISPECIES: LysE family translocator [unclassified Pseudomonas]|uniref:LysE family translocator n=1 Tax=unclassified Pseudomonas TaxID=196821 RepID=UPI000BD9D94E|nr:MULTISPECIES: LysE family translocator [unclassified Pseudomonas]PVZ13937.1 L-lysine exporter family protein LysE/ArgO [Pseudomonas sp. URIL14HWK12:I12]PVZ24243.1 L-lysine exporter family protein LysE/ArgO [Pseudomonas sp. URIL14HWK12:I10]PVZ33118.1 L-lysine exporter family protein LysE/ArgO [Pseudomonas sp. URIL14HWK12:I11]SNZ10454.1 L-lysine exporter family protein LysE/ArgO [Pseudomonas sp. URIL14HWK12:I9]
MEFSNGFLLSLSLCLDIGVANIAMITLAMQRGALQGFWLGLGTCFGDLFYAILAVAGMAVLLRFEAVRWVLWLGGSALLVLFAINMLRSAWRGGASLEADGPASASGGSRAFVRGFFLAVSSPSAILWFAAVGGALISRAGGHGALSTGLFLGGFFCAGLVWSAGLCLAAAQGGRWLGAGLLRACYGVSAVIFSYFAVYVIVSGYREFVG